MQHIHWLGTGLSSIPGIRRLAQNYDYLTIWNRTIEKAEQSINHVSKQNVVAKKFDIDSLSQTLKAGDIVVSQLPANQHVDIAKLCLKKKCHFATSSYISPDMQNLDSDAKKNNLVFVNEVGLDPGIDHFFSHLLVKKLKDMNISNLDVTYHSYCGGFPAIPNDFRYKFSWSPVGVIKALNNDAKFIRDFIEVAETPYKNIGKYTVNNEIYEAYPNRDSTPYISEYKFDSKWRTKEFVRGTLRLNGWKNAWSDIFKMLDNKSPELNKQIDILGEELWKKHPYLQDEKDRVVLFVKLLARKDSKEVFNSFYALDEKGSGENTAMGKLVSITLSCAIDLIVENKMLSGVQAAPHDENLINYFFKTFEEYKIFIKNNL
ncbi:saccharopine dehydrogenase NADP-binding domain-containing protein [Pelagibacterales bacterium SAG-MED31]|nr:saccharopine dehydrogenase NADP-binding domain-containing protein [Pelagibacterales bacterium SAG-MED31]